MNASLSLDVFILCCGRRLRDLTSRLSSHAESEELIGTQISSGAKGGYDEDAAADGNEDLDSVADAKQIPLRTIKLSARSSKADKDPKG